MGMNGPKTLSTKRKRSRTRAVSRRNLHSTTTGLVRLNAEMRSIGNSEMPVDELISRSVDAGVQHSALIGLCWMRACDDGSVEPIYTRLGSPSLDNDIVRDTMIHAALDAFRSGQIHDSSSEGIRGASVIAVPFANKQGNQAVLAGIVSEKEQAKSDGLAACQMIVNHCDLWRAHSEIDVLAQEIRSTATVLELVSKAQDSSSVRGACYHIANELKEHFHCDFVAVGLRKKKTSVLQVGCSVRDF